VGAESFAMTERSGAWSRPTLLSVGGGGTTESDVLACGPDGDCSVGGWIQYGADDQTASYSAYVAGHTPPAWVDEQRPSTPTQCGRHGAGGRGETRVRSS
jgi:hypothetical protein